MHPEATFEQKKRTIPIHHKPNNFRKKGTNFHELRLHDNLLI